MSSDMPFGDLLRAARKKRGNMTQKQFVAALREINPEYGSQSSVSRWERKNEVPPPEVLAMISRVLGIPMSVLGRFERPGPRTTADRIRDLEEFQRNVLAQELAEIRKMVEEISEVLAGLADKRPFRGSGS